MDFQSEWQQALAREHLDSPDDAQFEQQLPRVFAASEFVSQSCIRAPGLLLALLSGGWLRAVCDADDAPLPDLTDVEDEVQLARVLRQYRRQQMVRIIWRDICRLDTLEQTLTRLTRLADTCINMALDKLYQWAIASSGVPRNSEGDAQSLMVIGMGKLGAGELNLSSDIDLIFVFGEHGETDGRRALPNEQFFVRLARKLIAALNEQTEDGFVFRVDMRLRPFGDSGPLVVSLDSLEHYLYGQAREWERYAMIKARVVAGGGLYRERLESMIHPFVFRRYIDFGVIESIRDMKRRIEGEMQRRGMDANIKLGRGGIREIEFIGQVFQLIRGGREPALQIRAILLVLQELGQLKLLPAPAVEQLTEAYVFLRLLENRIQAWQDQQTHILPDSEAELSRLATTMNFDDVEEFLSVLSQHRENTERHFQAVFATPEASPGEDSSVFQKIWLGELDIQQCEFLLQEHGFVDASSALERITSFSDSPVTRSLTPRAREKLDRLMPQLLQVIVDAGTPDPVLERILGLLQAIVRRIVYLDLLLENPNGIKQLVRLIGESSWVATQLTQQPLLLDEFLDPRRLYSPLKKAELVAEWHALSATVSDDDLEHQMELLRQFNNGNRLRVAAADIAEVIPVSVVSDYLTEIAEVVLQGSLALAWQYLLERHGRPTRLDTQGSGFAIIGYGKLGGWELGYGSDLDLVFLHTSVNQNAMTDGERPVANDVFYARLGQRLIHILTTRTPSGQLYETDMRLRPNGNSGLLVTGMSAFGRYQREDAWVWEHQALVRARAVAGDPAAMTAFERTRRETLGQPRDEDELRTEVVAMREKMRASLDRSDETRFDLKQGRGGIADIEFMVQYSVLRWAAEHPRLLDHADNYRILEAIEDLQLLETGEAELLASAYRGYRAIYHRKALQEMSGLVVPDAMQAEREQVIACWQRLML